MILTDRDRQALELFDEIVVSFSAGKDSLTCLRWALETGKRVRAILADTGNEPPDTPEYLHYVERALGVPIEVYQREGHTFAEIVRGRKVGEQQGMWPIPGKCLVSRTVKQDDFKWYLKRTDTSDNALMILGQRASESKRRATLPDFSPIVRSGLPCYRPILDWSLDDVFSFLGREGLRAHPAYGNGRKRVGCVWCVNSAHDDLVRDEQLYPERCTELRVLRAEIGLASTLPGVSQAELFSEQDVCRYDAVHCE